MKSILIIYVLLLFCFGVKGQGKLRADDTLKVTRDGLVNDDDFTEPHFPGGLKQFYIYLSKNIHYPANEEKDHVQGKVNLTFAIEKDGSIGDIKVTKGVSKNIDSEAVRVLKNSPKWIPGTHHRKPNVVYESIPITFQFPKIGATKHSEDDKIYIGVEHQPEFPGGMAAFNKYLVKNLKAGRSPNGEIKTKLIVQFVVEKDGSLSSIKVLKSISPITDRSAIDALKRSPKWIPGKIHNEPVRVRYVIPAILEFQQADQ